MCNDLLYRLRWQVLDRWILEVGPPRKIYAAVFFLLALLFFPLAPYWPSRWWTWLIALVFAGMSAAAAWYFSPPPRGDAHRSNAGRIRWWLAHGLAFLAALWPGLGAYRLLLAFLNDSWLAAIPIYLLIIAAATSLYVWFTRELRSSEARIGDLGPTLLGNTVILLISVALAAFTYSQVVGWCYRNLARAYAEANVLADVFATDPTLVWQPGAEGWLVVPPSANGQGKLADSEFRRLQLFRLLQLTALVGSEDTPEKGPRKKAVDHLFEILSVPPDSDQFYRRKASTLQLVVFLAQKKGDQNRPGVQELEYRQKTSKLLAAALALQPGFEDAFRDLVRDDNNEHSTDELDKLLSRFGQNFGPSMHVASGGGLSDAEIINLLYQQTNVASKFSTIADPGSINKLGREQFQLVNDLVSALVSRIHSNPDVRNAQFYLAIILGYEQFGEILIFWWLVFLMGYRLFRYFVESRAKDRFLKALSKSVGAGVVGWAKRQGVVQKALEATVPAPPGAAKEDAAAETWARRTEQGRMAQILANSVIKELKDDKDDANPDTLIGLCDEARDNASATRWLIRWLAKALPALGFIGTVRGMLLALGNADSIVLAQSTAAQASAVTAVAGQLGICFTTTFLALILGLIASYLNDQQIFAEGQLIGELETKLKPMVKPSAQQQLPEPAASTKVAAHE